MDALHHLDDRLMLAVNTFARHTGWLHAVTLDYATYGVVLFGVLLVLGLLIARHRPDRTLAAAGWACVATLVAVAVNQPIGSAIHEARPYATHPQLLTLAAPTSDFSFPSDHAVMAGAAAAGLYLVGRRLGLVAVALAVLMACARVYIAAHYPWDVVAGLLLGAAVSLAGWWLLRVPLTLATRWLRTRPVLRSAFPDGPAPSLPTPSTADPAGTRP
jgi:membrane-associated phospholipid phosphatase